MATVSYFINKDNAKALNAKSTAKRLENAAKLREAAAITDELIANAKANTENSEVFLASVLARVRKQISDTLTSLDEDNLEPIDRERLSRSLGVLLEQDRQLSNRPLPGTLKPSSKPAKQSRTSYPEPEPQYSVIHEAPKPVPVPKPDAGLDGDGI